MKKGILLLICSLFLTTHSVKAASSCSYKELAELNNLATQTKVSYEIKVGTYDENEFAIPDILIGTDEENSFVAEYKYLVINVLNITEQTYAVLRSDTNSLSYTINYDDTTNGIYKIDWKELSKVTKITVDVYSSTKTGCPNEKLYTTYLTLPRLNTYAALEACDGSEQFYLCQDFVTYENIDYDAFVTKLNDYKSGKVNNDGEQLNNSQNMVLNFLVENKVTIIVIGCILIVGVVTVITLKSKRRKTDEKIK